MTVESYNMSLLSYSQRGLKEIVFIDLRHNMLYVHVSCHHPPQLEKCSQDLGTSTKAVSSAIAQLLSEATQGNENYAGKGATLGIRDELR